VPALPRCERSLDGTTLPEDRTLPHSRERGAEGPGWSRAGRARSRCLGLRHGRPSPRRTVPVARARLPRTSPTTGAGCGSRLVTKSSLSHLDRRKPPARNVNSETHRLLGVATPKAWRLVPARATLGSRCRGGRSLRIRHSGYWWGRPGAAAPVTGGEVRPLQRLAAQRPGECSVVRLVNGSAILPDERNG